MSAKRDGPAYGVIAAAGSSRRMDGADKVFAQLAGRPLIAWTLRAFQLCECIDSVIVVASPESVEKMRQLVAEWRFNKVAQVVAGGGHRQDSVRRGIEAATEAAIVVVHDGARPLVQPELIERGIALAREHGAAICALPSHDTVKEVGGDPAVVRSTLDRDHVWTAQTPQVFDRALLLDAHARAEATLTDDAALVEAAGHTVRVYEGDPTNVKVTVADDLLIAETLLRARFER